MLRKTEAGFTPWIQPHMAASSLQHSGHRTRNIFRIILSGRLQSIGGK